MSNERFFRVRKWDEYQHYKDRRPTWLKLYTSLLADPTWVRATCEQRVLIITLLLLAPSTDNVLLFDADYIRMAGNLPFTPNLQWALDVRFIEECEREAKWQPKSVNSIAEERREEKRRGEQAAGAPSRSVKTRAQIRSKATATGFEDWWEAYGKVGNRATAERAWVNDLKADQRGSMLQLTGEYMTRRQAAKAKGVFVPTLKHGATYLRNEGWLDEFGGDQGTATATRQQQQNSAMSAHERQMAVRCAERRGLERPERLSEERLLELLHDTMRVVHDKARSAKVLPKVQGLPVGDQIRWYHQEVGKAPEAKLEKLGGLSVRDADGKLKAI